MLFLVFGLAASCPDRPPLKVYPKSPVAGQPDYNGWLEKADLPYPLAHQMAASLQDSADRYFVFGGQRSVHGTMQQNCLKYSALTNSWSLCTPMRFPRGIGRAIAVKNLIYVLGGCETFGTGLPKVEVYDPFADTWSVAPNMPESLYDFGAATWRDSIIYLFGGGNWSPGSPPTGRVWLFDPANSSWDSATPLPVPIGALCSEIIGDTIIVATGWTESGPTNAVWCGLIEPSDPKEIIWERFDTLPGMPRCRTVSSVVNNRIYLVGGILEQGVVSNETWMFDPQAISWQMLPPKPHPISDVYGTGIIHDKLYFPGGFPGTAPYLKAHDALNTGQYAHDIGVNHISSPKGRLVPDRIYPVIVWVQNFGGSAETFTASSEIVDSLSHELLFESNKIVALDTGESRTVDFGQFDPGPGRIFKVMSAVHLAGDENPDNDTARCRCRTTSGSEPDGYGYIYRSTQEPDTIIFQWFDPTGGDTIDDWEPNPDDGISERDLSFPFPFYGDSIEEIYICTNGFLETSELSCPVNRNLPFYDMTDIIAPFWDDLTLRESGTVIEKQDTDKVAWTWIEVPRYPSCPKNAEKMTFQIILHADGRIQFNYLSLDGNQASSTIGIQGRDGTWRWFLEYACNGEPANHIPADSLTIVFAPPVTGIREQPSCRLASLLSLECPTICTQTRISIRIIWHTPDIPKVNVFDVCGRLITAMNLKGNGNCTIDWNLDNHARLAPGAYFLRVTTSQANLTKKLVITD